MTIYEGTVKWLEPVTDGTKLFVDFEAVPHGWFKLIFPLFLMRLRKRSEPT